MTATPDISMLMGSGEQKPQDDFFKVVKMQYDGSNKNIDMITQLTHEEVVNLARVQVLDDWCENKVPAIKIFVSRFMRMKVSQERQGRKEFFDTWKAAGQEHAKMSMLGGLFQRRQEPPI